MKSRRESRTKFLLCQITVVIGVLLTFSGCAREASGPERRIENGIEVVINGERPYPVAGKLATLTIKEEFRIDLEDPKYAEMGLSDVAKADLDSHGRVVLFRQYRGDGPLVFIFDERGSFLRSFGCRGQGPGEITYPSPVGVTDRDEIVISESNTKLFYFAEDGAQLRSVLNSGGIPYVGRSGVVPLANGSYLIQFRKVAEGGRALDFNIGVFDSRFRKVSDLASFHIPDTDKITNPFIGMPIFCRSRDEIIVGSPKGEGDISVFDLNGLRKRIIRKRYRSVLIPASFQDDLLRRLPEGQPVRKTLMIPSNFPPFQFLFADDQGRLYVSTYEKDPATGQNICEIFAPDGTYILRAAIGYFDFVKQVSEGQPGEVIIRNGRVLCIRDKDNGYREVIVSSIKWE